jgi:hypothetical protein
LVIGRTGMPELPSARCSLHRIFCALRADVRKFGDPSIRNRSVLGCSPPVLPSEGGRGRKREMGGERIADDPFALCHVIAGADRRAGTLALNS